MSSDEKIYADVAGVSLIETPIALDALVFIVNPGNPIKSLTTKQIQDIYMDKITYWNEVGGGNTEIAPYVRNPNSGSQELMETLVMKDLDITEFPVNDELIIFNMTGTFDAVIYEKDAICYTVYYFKEYMVTGVNVKSLAINEIYPDKETIGNNSYPYVAEVFAVIRSDLDKSSMAYKLYKWLQTEAGKQVINESGYIPYY
jgi:phosphate transport system substrate-binding protein